MLKKIISILLMALLLLDTSSLLIFYAGKIQLRKAQMISYIANTDNIDKYMLTAFSATDKNVELVNKHEISYNGKMYDIVKTNKQNGKTIYYVLSDIKEDELLDNITQLEKHNTANGQQPVKKMTGKILKFITNNGMEKTICFSAVVNNNTIAVFNNQYHSPYIGILSPPPKALYIG